MIEYENLKKLNEPFEDEYKSVFSSILESGWYVLGENVKKFEIEYARFCNTDRCVGLASGLDALILALKCFNFPKGSEVIVPSNTYIATILAIIHNDLKPVLVEPDIATYNIDPKKIEEKITKNTKAILVVHLYGKCCQMDEILSLSKIYDLRVIEDCAQSHGAKFGDQISGSFGEIGAHSFYPTKNLGAIGDAGAITTNLEWVDERVRSLRNYGSKIKYVNELIGYNSRLDELQAGLLSVKLKRIDEITLHKRNLANIYFKNLKSDYILPQVDPNYYDVFHIFAIRHENRNELKKYLLDNNIKTEIHYPIPPHKQEAMKGIISGKYPIAETIHETILSIPISYYHSVDDINIVVDCLNSFNN
jgi:dTDP-4-amino-4,6-dideoxygalactose transaminase